MTDPIPFHGRIIRAVRILAAVAAVAALSGCAAVSSLSNASRPLPAYTLTPLAGTGVGGGSRHVVVEAPTATSAIATDRILVRPGPLQIAYLPDARWIDPAPVLTQNLLVQSMQASGAFRLVSRTGMGLFPDYTLVSELDAFQLEPAGTAEAPVYVARIAITATLVRESDGAAAGTRRFEGVAPAASDEPLVAAAAFDRAMDQVLREVVQWTAGGGGGV